LTNPASWSGKFKTKEGFKTVNKNKYIMNKKEKSFIKGRVINIRLTSEEEKFAKELRSRFNINISSFIRNAIRTEYDNKIIQRT
jgi:hypothetical protein